MTTLPLHKKLFLQEHPDSILDPGTVRGIGNVESAKAAAEDLRAYATVQYTLRGALLDDEDGLREDDRAAFLPNAEKVFEKMFASHDKRLQSMVAHRAKLQADIDASFAPDPARKHMAPEIRAFYRALDPVRKLSFLREAALERDNVTVSAILEAPRHLLGVDKSTYDQLRTNVESVYAEDMRKARNVVDELIGQMANLRTWAEEYQAKLRKKYTPAPKRKAREKIEAVLA